MANVRVGFGTSFSCGLLAAILLLSLVPGLEPAEPAQAAPAETTLRIGFLEPLSSLNPFIGILETDRMFYNLVYDSLTAIDQDMNVSPNLALSWYAVPDALPYGSVWQYNLTHSATWHDGQPMTAADVNFTINYQVGVNFFAMWAYQPYTILIDHAVEVDSYTVRIHFKDLLGTPSPCSFGDKLMIPIVPKHIWQSIPPAEASFSYENPFPIGTGPFKCTVNTESEFNARRSILLFKNENYHALADFGKEVAFDKLALGFYLEPSALLTDIEMGSLDVAKLDTANYRNLEDYLVTHPGAPISAFAGPTCTSYSSDIMVNMKADAPGVNPLRLDPEVRKAMAYAIDKNFIRDWIFQGYAQTGSSLIGPSYGTLFWEPSPGEAYEFNLTLANQTLDAAGYEWNVEHTARYANSTNPYFPNGPLEFTIVVMQGRVEDLDTAALLAYDWGLLGIEVNIVIYDFGQWNTVVFGYSSPYDLAVSYWSGDPDPNYLLFTQTSYAIGGWSENAYSSPEYDENYTESVGEMNAALRNQSILNMQRLMYRDTAVMVTAYPYGCYAWRTDTFSGWGNWSAHDGRRIDARWGPNPVLFDLVPNTAPSASFTVTPTIGDTSTVFEFDASGCTDAEDLPADLEVRWDWENDGSWDTGWSTAKTETHKFTTTGMHTIGLAVRDTHGLVNNTTADILVTEPVIPEFNALPLVVLGLLAIAAAIREAGRLKPS